MNQPTSSIPAPPTVHVVDDDESIRRAMARLLGACGYAARTYETAQQFLERPADEGPACVILDLRLRGASGLDVQQTLATQPGSVPIIFMSGFGTVQNSVLAMKSGALDFLTKPIDSNLLLEAVEHALARSAQEQAARSRKSSLTQRYQRLTPREREVFAHLISGQLNKQVGFDLGISERTVKLHRHQVLEKMEADSIADLVRIAGDLEIPTAGKVR